MDLLQLKYFYKIATSDTMTRAAKELHVSQPSLSSMLRKMEAELGGSLFEKEGRNLRLNERGEVLLRHAEEILKSLDELRQEIDEINEKKHTSLTIQIFAASRLMLPAIQNFQSRYPNIQVNLVQSKGSRQALKEEPDFIITADWKPPAMGTILLREELVLAVPADHPLADCRRVDIHQLADQGFILLSPQKVLREIIDVYCEKVRFQPRIILESDEIEMVKTFIRMGHGVSIIPEISWNEGNKLLGANLKKIHIEPGTWERYIFFRQKDERPPNKTVKLFSREILQAFSGFKEKEPREP